MKLGLNKLNEAESSVKELSKELVVKEKELEVANVKAQGILEEVCDFFCGYNMNKFSRLSIFS